MKSFRLAVLFSIALLIPMTMPTPARAQFGVSIRVGFAPPPLVVFDQPICPAPNLMWTPGYWAYDNVGGYYWVPGAWVPAPYVGALWTPPYWGWSGGQYVFYNGYWGPHVGFYGGVNYGFGYGGIGFSGGMWNGGVFSYNTAVMRVNTTVIRNTYVNTTVVNQGIVRNPGRVSYNGGNGGINRTPSADEQRYSRESHTPPTRYQARQLTVARADKTSFAKVNGGRPTRVVEARPLAAQKVAPPKGMPRQAAPAANAANKAGARPATSAANRAVPGPSAKPPARGSANHATNATRPAPKTETRPSSEAHTATRPAPQAEPRPSAQARTTTTERTPQTLHTTPKQAPEQHASSSPTHEPARPATESRSTPVPHSTPESRPAPQQRSQPAPRPAPAPHSAPAPREQPRK